MSELNKARRRFKIKIGEKQDTSDAVAALLGRGDSAHTVVVPNQAGQVYIRVGNQENYGTAYNDRVPNTDNLPVFVGYDTLTDPDRRLFQVLSIRQSAYVDAGNPPIASIGPHHETHEYGGGDDTFIAWRRLMGLRVGRPNVFEVTVDAGYIYRGATWIAAPVGAATVDLAVQHAALTGSQAQYVLISLSPTGAISVLPVGTIKASPALLLPGDIPTPPAGNIPLAAVRIYAAQTAIGDTPTYPDIIDLRFPTYASMNNGGVAGLDTQIQYNDGGVFGADADMAWDDINKSLLIGGPHGLGALGNSAIINTGDAHSGTFISTIYGANNPAFAGFRARGTFAAPTKALSGDYLAYFSGRGYATTLGWEPGSRGGVAVVAAEDHENAAHGTNVVVRATPIGATTIADVARFDNASGIRNLAAETYSTLSYVLTAAKTGILPVGTGAATHVAFWQDTNQIEGYAPNAALNLILPSQAGQSGNVLGTDGANTSWVVGGGGGGGNIIIANLPCGAMIDWPCSSIPSGWLERDGSAVSRVTYADLFAVIGITFGPGDGSTTFNLPGESGRVSVGRGHGSGLTNRVLADTGGEETHVLTEAEMPSHNHQVDISATTPGGGSFLSPDTQSVPVNEQYTGDTGGDDPHENMPPFIVLVKLIKYTNASPADLIFNDGADPEDVSMLASATGDDVYAARRDHVHLYTLDWPAGNVIYVPLTGDIQTYVNAATEGDTLVLASGEYIITSTITVNKQLNIIGQGNAGFYTIPSAAGHGTAISSVTASVTAFHITSSNVRIAHMSINLSGAASTAVDTANNLDGIVFTNIDAIVVCTGLAQGFMLYGSNAVFRNLTFYIESTNGSATGLYFYNTAATTQNAICDCFTVTGVTKGNNAGGDNWCYLAENQNDANTLTLNLSQSVCKALAGTGLDIGIASVSFGSGTNSSIVNAYFCTLEGENYDAYQDGTNQLNLGGSVLVNNLVFGIVTYRTAMAAGLGVFGSTVTLNGLTASTAVYANANKEITSLANAAGVLTNNGAGALSWSAAGTGDISGTGVVGQVAEFVTDTKTLQAAKLIGPAVNILTLTATAASTLALAVGAGKTLTFTAAENSGITFPAAGAVLTIPAAGAVTAALGAGTLTNATTNDVTVAAHTHAVTGPFTSALAATYIGYGNGGGLLTGSSALTWNGQTVTITHSSIPALGLVIDGTHYAYIYDMSDGLRFNEFGGRYRFLFDVDSYMTVTVANATGVATFNAVADAGAGSFVFTPPVTFSAAPLFSTMSDTWLLYAGASGVLSGSANATLDASGNAKFLGKVGIGVVPAATSKLHVYVGAYGGTPSANSKQILESDSNAYFTMYAPNTAFCGFTFGDPEAWDAGAIYYNHASNYLRFDTGSNERMRIDNAGAVTISGAFGCNGATAQTRLTVTGAKGGNTALASLLTQLVAFGFITDSTSA